TLSRSCVSESKLKTYVRKQRKQCPAPVYVAKSLAGYQRSCPAGDGYVFSQRGTVAHPDARVDSDSVANGGLEKEELEWLGAFKPQVIHVHEAAQLRGQIEIRTHIREKDSRIHEVGLPFIFVRAQARQQAVGRRQRDASTGQPDSFAIPKAEDPASKLGKIFDGIKSARAAAARIRRSGGVKH